MSLPKTVWRPTDGENEMFSSDGAVLITEDDFILTTEADEALQIEDGAFTTKPATIWLEDDGV